MVKDLHTTFGNLSDLCSGRTVSMLVINDRSGNAVCEYLLSRLPKMTLGSNDNRNNNDWCEVIHCDSDASASKTIAFHCTNRTNSSSWYFCENKNAKCIEYPVLTNLKNSTYAIQPIQSDTTGLVIGAIIAALVILVPALVIFCKIRHVGIFRKMPEKNKSNTTHNQRMPEYNETNENFIENNHTVTNSAYGFTSSEPSGSHHTQQQLHVSNPSNVYAKVVKKEDTQPNPAPDRDTNNLCDTENDYHRLNQVAPPITTPQGMNTYDSTHGILGQCDPTYAKTNRNTTKQLTEGIDHYAINVSIEN